VITRGPRPGYFGGKARPPARYDPRGPATPGSSWARPPSVSWQTPGGGLAGRGPVTEDIPSYEPPKFSPVGPRGPGTWGGPVTVPKPPTLTGEEEGGGGGGGGGGDKKPPAYDPKTDPFFLDWEGQQIEERKAKAASVNRRVHQSLLGFGSMEMARRILGPDADLSLMQLAQPTSWLGKQQLAFEQGRFGYNEEENASNLWYGGGRQYGLEFGDPGRTGFIGSRGELNLEDTEARRVGGEVSDFEQELSDWEIQYQKNRNDLLLRLWLAHLPAGSGVTGAA
jgi:hypothetical protein